jgi:hypothetical protein
VKIVEDVYGIWAADLRVLVQRAGNTAKGAAERMHVREQLWGIIQRYKPTRPLLLNAFDSFSVKKLATISSSSSTIQSEAATGFAPGELLVEYLRGLELIENALISCCKKDEWSPNDMDKSDIRQPLLNTLW